MPSTKPPLLGTRSSGALNLLLPDPPSRRKSIAEAMASSDCSSAGDLTGSEDEADGRETASDKSKPFSLRLRAVRHGPNSRSGDGYVPYTCTIRVREPPRE